MRQILLYVFILLVCSVSAEQFKITGKVVDAENNEPLIGTTVQIKGTDRRTGTDIDGNFSIEVEKGAILRFSYVGCKSKEVEVLNDSSLFIELEEVDSLYDLSDIVSVSYQKSLQSDPPVWLYRSIHKSDSLRRALKNQKGMINH